MKIYFIKSTVIKNTLQETFYFKRLLSPLFCFETQDKTEKEIGIDKCLPVLKGFEKLIFETLQWHCYLLISIKQNIGQAKLILL